MGDGEQQEGQIWEAAMFAAHNKIDNLIATVDLNGQQIDGPTEQVNAIGNLKAKYASFGVGGDDVMVITWKNLFLLLNLEKARKVAVSQ